MKNIKLLYMYAMCHYIIYYNDLGLLFGLEKTVRYYFKKCMIVIIGHMAGGL